MIDQLPIEIVLEICSNLKINDRLNLSICSIMLHNISKYDKFLQKCFSIVLRYDAADIFRELLKDKFYIDAQMFYQFHLSDPNRTQKDNHLKYSLKYGNINLIKYILCDYLTTDPIKYIVAKQKYKYTYHKIICKICKYGHTELIDFLIHLKSYVSVNKLIETKISEYLSLAMLFQQYSVIKYFIDKFLIKIPNLCKAQYFANLCYSGYIDLAQQILPLIPEYDMTSLIFDDIIIGVCMNKQLVVLQWIANTFRSKINVKNIKSKLHFFPVNITEYLITFFHLSNETNALKELSTLSIAYENFELAEWLHDVFLIQ